jgi:hypothetical protein
MSSLDFFTSVMARIEYSGEHQPVSGDLAPSGRALPSWQREQKDQCVIRPARQIVRCTQFGTEVFDIPEQITCSDPENHHHESLLPHPDEEWYEKPGWTPLKH